MLFIRLILLDTSIFLTDIFSTHFKSIGTA